MKDRGQQDAYSNKWHGPRLLPNQGGGRGRDGLSGASGSIGFLSKMGKMYEQYWFYKYPVKVGQCSLKMHLFLKQHGVKCMKILVSQGSSKSRLIFIEKLFFKQNEVKCMKKNWFYKYPIQIGQFSLKKHGF